MKYDFDAMHNRRIAGDIKYNCPSDVIPMWVADMDFKAPNEISDALTTRTHHYITGGNVFHRCVYQCADGNR